MSTRPRQRETLDRPRYGIGVPVLLVVVGLTVAACTGERSVSPAEQPTATATPTIPQPIVHGLAIGPEAARVDLAMPTFSNPTEITNPWFPVSSQESVLMLGEVDGKPFRTEVTLLPGTRIIEWGGQQVETLVSQYTAYLGGRIHEVAYDFYAQDDEGSVWYFGEDVFNFADGAIVDTHGTWIAGKDGPAAMIMPADPQVGDTYRPENIPGFVFEEVTVVSVGRVLDGPLGPVDGGLVITELHMDGNTEGKTFAPGYGEFLTAGGGDREALTLAVPTDAQPGPVPAAITSLEAAARRAFDAALAGDWRALSREVERISAVRPALGGEETPPIVAARLDRSIDELAAASDARDRQAAGQAAIDAAQWSLDLQLLYRAPVEIDLARFDVWASQMQLDAAAGDAAAVGGDLFTIDYIRDRIAHAIDPRDLTRINAVLEELQVPVGEGNLRASAEVVSKLRAAVAKVELTHTD